jgi:hypothetical protein
MRRFTHDFATRAEAEAFCEGAVWLKSLNYPAGDLSDPIPTASGRWEIQVEDHSNDCAACEGTGWDVAKGERGCPFCHGTGEVPAEVRTLADDLKEDR